MTTAAPKRVRLRIGGMICASCAARVERKLNKLDGVDATVDYAAKEAAVSFDDDALAAGNHETATEKSQDLLAAVQRFAKTT